MQQPASLEGCHPPTKPDKKQQVPPAEASWSYTRVHNSICDADTTHRR